MEIKASQIDDNISGADMEFVTESEYRPDIQQSLPPHLVTQLIV